MKKFFIILSIMLIGIFKIVFSQTNVNDSNTSVTEYVEKIVFDSDRYGSRDIFLMNPDGSGLETLTTNPADDCCPCFSPDGSKIAFESDRDGNLEIYIMNNDGSNQTRITNSLMKDGHPDWSPDGGYIAFTRWSPDSWDDGDIFVIDTSGTTLKQLTYHTADDMRPIWSKNGTDIIFNSKRNGNYEIYKMDTSGANIQQITNTNWWEIFPQPSPDFQKITYLKMQFNPQYGAIHVMNYDGSGDTVLTSGSYVNENPAWSPDGNQIVFQTSRDGNFEIYTMNSDGTNETRLTNNPSWDGWAAWGEILIPTGIDQREKTIPDGLVLYQNYPNPFYSVTTILYSLQKASHVQLKIYNMNGQLIKTLINDFMTCGDKSVVWDGTNNSGQALPAGVYYCLFQTDSQVQSMKILFQNQ